MSNRLELRSTFQFSAEAVGANMQEGTTPGILSGSFRSVRGSSIPEVKQESRKNNFAVASTLAQAVMSGLGADLRSCVESYSSQKLSSFFNKHFDSTARHLSVSGLRNQTVDYDLNPKHSFEQGVQSKFCVRKGEHAGHVIFHIPPFVPQKDLEIPKTATNFKICARLITVSDFEKSGDDFHTKNIRQHGQGVGYQSDMLPLLRITTQPITTQLRISTPGFSPAGISSILVVGVKFYNYDHKKFTQLEECTRLKILEVF